MSGLIELTTDGRVALFSPPVLHPACLCFSRGVVGIRTVEPHAFGVPAIIELGANDVPALAEVKHPMMRGYAGLGAPAFGRDSNPVTFRHQKVSLVCVCGRRRRPGQAPQSRWRARCPAAAAAR